MFGTGTLQYPLAVSYSDGSWLVLPETLAPFFSVLRETSACAGRAGLGWEHGAAQPHSEGGQENQGLVASVSPQALKHFHRDFTTGQEKLCLPWTPESSADLQQSLAAGAALQLDSLGISRPAINKFNWMFEAFLTWHQGTPSGFICLVGEQRIWPHAALSHRTALLPLTLARPWHT